MTNPSPTSTSRPFRVALITFSAPWPENPLTGIYNLLQAQGLGRIGCQAEIIVCTLRYPRLFERFSPGIRRMNARPHEWTYQGVACRAVPALFPHPMWVRWRLAWRFPRIAEWLVSAAYQRGLRRELDRFQPDAIYVHDGVVLGALAATAAQRRGIPFGMIEHDAIVWDRTTPLGRRYAEVGARAAAVFGVGLPSVWAIKNNLGLTNGRFCPNGIARASDQQLRTPRPDKYRGKRLVLTTGSPIPTKGHAELVRALAEADVPDSLLIMVGYQQRPEVLDLIDKLGLAARVELLPSMPQAELQQYMAWADVFALPSRLESFGMVYAEAMAAGTPVILTSAAGIAPHVKHGVHGWVVPPLDHQALVQALRESLRQDKTKMGQAGRTLIGSIFTWETSARAIVAGLKSEPPPPGLDLDISDAAAMRAALPAFRGDGSL